jgi:N-formylglutamate deformylase
MRVEGSPQATRPNLVLHIPHSSRVVPNEERKNLILDDHDLERELLRMTDAFTDELFSPTPFETARVVFPISRLICDVERFIEDGDESMAVRGMGAVYVTTTEGGALRQNLTPVERTRIIERWYIPHHKAITSAVERADREGHVCIIVDCHSFSSRPLPHEPDQDPYRPDICIGTDNFHMPTELRDSLLKSASSAGLSVRVDRPFAGVLVPTRYYRTNGRVKAVMIEVNRRLYMDEKTGHKLPKFEDVRNAVADMLIGVAHCATVLRP